MPFYWGDRYAAVNATNVHQVPLSSRLLSSPRSHGTVRCPREHVARLTARNIVPRILAFWNFTRRGNGRLTAIF